MPRVHNYNLEMRLTGHAVITVGYPYSAFSDQFLQYSITTVTVRPSAQLPVSIACMGSARVHHQCASSARACPTQSDFTSTYIHWP
jgi:hypothetical protein